MLDKEIKKIARFLIEPEPIKEICEADNTIREVYYKMANIHGIENMEEFRGVVEELDKLSTPVVATFFSREELYTEWYVCPECNYDDIQKKDKYCGGCGKPIKIKGD